MKVNDNELGIFLRKLRIIKELTQQQVADKIGLTKNMISLHENRVRREGGRDGLISFLTMIRLADVYEVHHSVIIDKAVKIVRREGLLNKTKSKNGRKK